MAFAAELTSIRRMSAWLDAAGHRREGLLWRALAAADEKVRSPPESRLRQRYVAAGHPRPLCNREVRDADGAFVGIPDLLDVEVGLAIEYDGAIHRSRARHRSDVHRRERFERAGMVMFVVVAGDLEDRERLTQRLAEARARAARTSNAGWRLVVDRGPSLDELIADREEADRRTRSA